ncbi:MAG: TIGR00341 family protein, partial [Prevotella sp.]|nr:TIGR00341 family protein [Prevotella sp.]
MEKYNILSALKEHFVVKQFMENEDEIVLQIKQGVTFTGPNLWVLVFAIFIASLGLNVNSTAVIIGAMLISPLMGPIIG